MNLLAILVGATHMTFTKRFIICLSSEHSLGRFCFVRCLGRLRVRGICIGLGTFASGLNPSGRRGLVWVLPWLIQFIVFTLAFALFVLVEACVRIIVASQTTIVL